MLPDPDEIKAAIERADKRFGKGKKSVRMCLDCGWLSVWPLEDDKGITTHCSNCGERKDHQCFPPAKPNEPPPSFDNARGVDNS